jgi:hypothetical protein
LLPDDAITACVLLGEQNEPTLVALDGQQLYLLTVPRPGEVPAATGKLRTIRVAPDTGTAEVDATCRGVGEYPPQEAIWRFKLDGVAIELQINRDAEGRTTSDWPLAKALAEALGWKISQGE